MSQSNRPRKGTQADSRQTTGLGVVAALVVVGVFIVLGFMLAGRINPSAAPVTRTDSFAAETPAAIPPTAVVAAVPTPPPAQSDTASRANQYPSAPPQTIDPAKNYTATITTPRGDVVIKLRPDIAPITVNSFVFLARQGYYDGLTWHRVLDGFMAQGGDPTGTGGGGPGYAIPGEFSKTVFFDKPGIVAMARTNDPDSAGSQFFITFGPTPSLDSQYAIFGEVTQGMDIVNGIPRRDPDSATTPGEKMVKVTITES